MEHTVAEMALLLAGVASRRILGGDAMVREGRWGTQEMLFGGGGVFELRIEFGPGYRVYFGKDGSEA